MIKLSVICPFYNEERYVRQCVEGILSQDYPLQERRFSSWMGEAPTVRGSFWKLMPLNTPLSISWTIPNASFLSP